jgi:chromosome segregation ATPase
MKRSDVKKLLGDAATDEVVDSILELYGKSIESHKGKLTAAEETAAALQGQLDEASKQIESFKKLDPDAIKAAAADWEAKANQFKSDAEQAKADAEKRIAEYRLNMRLEAKLKDEFKVKNPKRVISDLDRTLLKYDEEKDDIVGNLEEQLKPVKEKEPYLFDDDKPAPKFVTGGGTTPSNEPTLANAIESALGIKK